jgi:hypothetical protein
MTLLSSSFPFLNSPRYSATIQRGISFNQVFGWEMTLLDPKEYWRKVPAKWKPYWHFFNTPISADPLHADSPVRLIKQIATPGDGANSCMCVVQLLLLLVMNCSILHYSSLALHYSSIPFALSLSLHQS